MAALNSKEQDWLTALRRFRASWDASGNGFNYAFLGDNPFPHFVFVQKAGSWGDFMTWHDGLGGSWGFRGQRKSEWLLHSTLDRAVRVKGGRPGYEFAFDTSRQVTEDQLLFKFRQQAHQYLRHLPENSDLVSWLALMQHHGAPSRLLDWTRSPYVSAYFAFEEEADQDSAIWAIDLDWLRDRCSHQLQSEGKAAIPDNPIDRARYLNELLNQSEGGKDSHMVIEVDPSKTDAWMTSQQGFFLSKRYSLPTFNQLLTSMMIHPVMIDRPVIRKLDLTADLRLDFLRSLRRMNIHRGSLFPGLDGFARSLGIDWRISKDELRRHHENSSEPPVDVEAQ